MHPRRTLLDPSLWILIAINGYLTWYYYGHPEVFTTLIWLYWSQSVLLGLFNFLDILTVRKPAPVTMGTSAIFNLRDPAAFFFLFHYGFFHIVYLVFLFTMKQSGPFQWDLFRNFFYAFLFGQIVNFIQHKIRQRKEETNLSTMFFIPYLRIIPMHLTILLPNFIPVTNLGIFVVLKSVTDVLMYMITSKTNKKSPELDKAMVSANQGMDM